jgi:hypothetical protein
MPLSAVVQLSSSSWQSILLMEETGVSGENHRPATSQTKYHMMLYHTITTMTPRCKSRPEIKNF